MDNVHSHMENLKITRNFIDVIYRTGGGVYLHISSYAQLEYWTGPVIQ